MTVMFGKITLSSSGISSKFDKRFSFDSVQ